MLFYGISLWITSLNSVSLNSVFPSKTSLLFLLPAMWIMHIILTCYLGRPVNSGFSRSTFLWLAHAFYFTSLPSLSAHTANCFVHSLTISVASYCSAFLQPWQFTYLNPFHDTVGKISFIAFQFGCVIES